MNPPQNSERRSTALRRCLDKALIWLCYRRYIKHLSSGEGRVSVDFSCQPITRIAALRWCRLWHLGLYGTKIEDWSIIRDIDFLGLNAGGTNFAEMELLRGKRLRWLELYDSPVASLDAIAGMPLSFLQIGRTKIRDFTPVETLPLEILLMEGTECHDISFLRSMNLEHFGFTFSPDTRGIDHLMVMSRLERVSTSPYDSFTPDEFIRRYRQGLPLDEAAAKYARN